MKKFLLVKFWSFLVLGLLFSAFGAYIFVSGYMSLNVAKLFMITGAVQLCLFYVLLFVKYFRKNT